MEDDRLHDILEQLSELGNTNSMLQNRVTDLEAGLLRVPVDELSKAIGG